MDSPDAVLVRQAPPSWQSEDEGTSTFYKIFLTGGVVFFVIIFWMGWSHYSSVPWACFLLDAVIMATICIMAYGLVQNNHKDVDDWVTNFYPPDVETWNKTRTAAESYLKAKRYEYNTEENSKGKEEPVVQFTLLGLAGSELWITILIREGDTRGNEMWGNLELHNIHSENYMVATTIATELVAALKDAGISYAPPSKRKMPIST